MKNGTIFLLKISIAFAFIYAGAAGIITPTNWVGYLPDFFTTFGQAETILFIWSIVEILLGLWILSGVALGLSAGLAAFFLFAMIVFNLSQFDILFRDVSLGLTAAALSYAAHKNTKQPHIILFEQIIYRR